MCANDALKFDPDVLASRQYQTTAMLTHVIQSCEFSEHDQIVVGYNFRYARQLLATCTQVAEELGYDAKRVKRDTISISGRNVLFTGLGILPKILMGMGIQVIHYDNFQPDQRPLSEHDEYLISSRTI